MQKTILLTGATDGIGLETAKMLVSQGHHVLLHGRNAAKLDAVKQELVKQMQSTDDDIETYIADLSKMGDVLVLANAVKERHSKLDVVINNAGIFRTNNAITQDGLDIRFVVNTLSPYLLTKELLPLLDENSRVVNLSSAAQAPVDLDALAGRGKIGDEFKAYAQSKLAITAWSRHLAVTLGDDAPVIVSVNPGSLLATKMVKEGFGLPGNDVGVGADILIRAALSDEFATASGLYFDNDAGKFAPPHSDALDKHKTEELIKVMESVLADIV
jgi:NAD(P)-dependent dehydrogenase (short-subunit alcohol dehydrogenase family)